MTARICLLSVAPLWVSPRLRKEADTLHAAGYDVVVGYRADGDISRDEATLEARPWRWHRIDVSRSRQFLRWAGSALRQHAAQALWRAGIRAAAIARAAYCRADDQLLAWAIAQRADLYIAHAQPTLAIAAAAATACGSRFAFDCEDLLAEEAADGGRAPWRRALITAVERRYLPGAAYVSATSLPMAQYLMGAYRLPTVHVWHNCFPVAESADATPPDHRSSHAVVQLAWISATVGPGRGLEDAFAALARLGPRVRLHIYGVVPAGAAPWLRQQLASLAADQAPILHPPVPDDRIVPTLAQHDVGLSLDPDACVNRSLTVSNKVFYYLHAGLPCIATDTPGHRSILSADDAFSVRYPVGDASALATAIEHYFSPDALRRAQAAAWQAGRTQYTWDIEAQWLRDVVAGVLTRGIRERASARTAVLGA